MEKIRAPFMRMAFYIEGGPDLIVPEESETIHRL